MPGSCTGQCLRLEHQRFGGNGRETEPGGVCQGRAVVRLSAISSLELGYLKPVVNTVDVEWSSVREKATCRWIPEASQVRVTLCLSLTFVSNTVPSSTMLGGTVKVNYKSIPWFLGIHLRHIKHVCPHKDS